MSVYSVVIIYNVMTPFLVQQQIGLSAQSYGLLSIVIAAPYWLGAFCNTKLLKLLSSRFMTVSGGVIIMASAGAMYLGAILFHHLNINILMVPFFLAIFGQSLAWSNAMAHAVQKFSQFPGVANSLFSCL